MKIFVIAYRHWIAEREYRSLILNAKRLGHQVWGIAETCHGDAPLTTAIYQELGIEGYHGERLQDLLNEINPDVIFGGRYRPWFSVERLAQDWANSHNKIGFLLHHYVLHAPGCEGGINPGPRTHLLCANEMQVESCIGPECEAAWPEGPSIWPKEQVHALGPPGFDVAFEAMDSAAIRTRLGAKSGQSLIGLFPTIRDVDFPSEHEQVLEIVQEANHRGWKVVIHPHPMFRRLQNSDDKFAFFNLLDVIDILAKTQEAGATIVVDYVPGTIMGVHLQQCNGFELQFVADCLLSTSHDTFFEAYAVGKRCHCFQNALIPTADELIDFNFEESFNSDIAKIAAILEKGPDYIEQDPKINKKWFYKLDGLFWQRALNLAEELR